MRVLDQEGKELAREKILGSAAEKRRGVAVVTVPQADRQGQVLTVEFVTPGARNVNIYPKEGLEPWIGTSADAPFPQG